MEKFSLSTLVAPFYDALERFSAAPNWRVKSLLICAACVVIFQFPEYQYLYSYAVSHTEQHYIYDTFVKQVADPLLVHNTDTDSHAAKMVFRLTIPLLARTLHLNIFGVLVAQLALGLTMLWALLTLIERLTQDRPTALLLTLGACFTYYGGAFVHDVYCYFDAFGYALLALMLWNRRPVVLYALSLIGCFVDERVLVASLLVVLWHSMRTPVEMVPTLRRPAITWASGAVVAGWVTYGALRLWLTHAFALKNYGGGVGLDAMSVNLHVERTALGFVTGLESFWLVAALAPLVLIARRQWGMAALFLGAAGPIIVGSFLVFDITRSLAFGFPMVLVALVVLGYYLNRQSLRHLALVVLGFAVLTPNYFYQLRTYYSESLFEKGAKFLLEHAGLMGNVPY